MLSALENVKQVRDRLRNPANGRHSSELEVLAAPALRKLRVALSREEQQARHEAAINSLIARAFERSAAETKAKAERKRFEEARGFPAIDSIIKHVCLWYGVTRIDVISERRQADVIRPRHVIMYLARHHTPLSLPRIGAKIGGRDHTTVLSGIRKIQSKLDGGDVELAADLDSLRRIVGVVE